MCVFHVFSNCTNSTKSHKASHIFNAISITSDWHIYHTYSICSGLIPEILVAFITEFGRQTFWAPTRKLGVIRPWIFFWLQTGLSNGKKAQLDIEKHDGGIRVLVIDSERSVYYWKIGNREAQGEVSKSKD